ncbi:MAG: leucyl aminopeptidase family protein [Bacteroidota bacterium]|nr:leucyl aminopeptidase family protein [Bacteroidota bacterium]
MKTHIKTIDSRAPEASVVYLIHKDTAISDLSFTKTESAYLKEKIEANTDFIHINSYFKHSFVVIIDEKANDKARESLRKKAHKACSIINEHKLNTISIDDKSKIDTAWFDFAEGLALSNYQFNKYFKEPKQNSLQNIHIHSSFCDTQKTQRINALVESVYFARDCVNEPHSHLNAIRFAELLGEAAQNTGLKVTSFLKPEIEAHKMGGLLAVNKGSEVGPSFTIMEWKPDNALNEKPLVLVGKGVMFDTGGVSLKPTKGSMDLMKSDMGGAAAVAGSMLNAAKSKIPLHVIGLIPATDNRPGKDAYLPQDVIHMYDGTTVEVLNTDAEGRMILADALAFAKQYNPELVIDLATLTGSAEVAVGIKAIAAMGNTPDAMELLKKAGFACHERIAELPFWDDYKEQIKSDIADLQNVGDGNAGAITAGKFLEHFTNYPYIHLDIAGPAFLESADSYRGKQGSGVGVRLLNDFFYFRTEKQTI